MSGGAGASGGGGGLAGDMFGPQTYARSGPTPSPRGLPRRRPTSRPRWLELLLRPPGSKSRFTTRRWPTSSGSARRWPRSWPPRRTSSPRLARMMGAALANNLTSALEQLAGGGEKDVGKDYRQHPRRAADGGRRPHRQPAVAGHRRRGRSCARRLCGRGRSSRRKCRAAGEHQHVRRPQHARVLRGRRRSRASPTRSAPARAGW